MVGDPSLIDDAVLICVFDRAQAMGNHKPGYATPAKAFADSGLGQVIESAGRFVSLFPIVGA
ncbi:MAG: hypothetical protein DMG15_16205 [Acidobacteria bacterium]|nr:MAG: hypothetical protein DMG16_03690 [Acidobacteriota bacterium]PYS11900.1 MAG: hypothetical protein DMG15_16205 [Acidobacteriota bacterium]